MIDLYRKSLNINFHNKIFTIFIANDYKCVFLELDDKGLYHYPLLEDFLCLDEIYNGDESKILYVTKKYRFKRRVKKNAGFWKLPAFFFTNCFTLIFSFSFRAAFFRQPVRLLSCIQRCT